MTTRTERLWPYATAKELASEKFTDGLVGWVGIKINVDKPNMAKIEPAMAKTKKPAELFAICDMKKLLLEIRVATAYKEKMGEFNFEAEKDIEKRRDLFKKINAKNKKLVTDQDLYDFATAHPAKETLDDAKAQVPGVELEIKKLKERVAGLKTFSFDKSASAELSRGLKEWTEKKHWGHYLAFVNDIDAGTDPKKIYDTYIGDAQKQATLPVNLDHALAGKIKKDIDAGTKPDFTAARTLIVKLIDAKFVPEYKKENLPDAEKELKHKEEYLVTLKALIAKGG